MHEGHCCNCKLDCRVFCLKPFNSHVESQVESVKTLDNFAMYNFSTLEGLLFNVFILKASLTQIFQAKLHCILVICNMNAICGGQRHTHTMRFLLDSVFLCKFNYQYVNQLRTPLNIYKNNNCWSNSYTKIKYKITFSKIVFFSIVYEYKIMQLETFQFQVSYCKLYSISQRDYTNYV